MARDYKNVTEAGLKAKQSSKAAKHARSSKQAKQKTSDVSAADENSIPGWLWLVSGVVIGGFVSFIVYLKLNVPIENISQPAQVEQTEAVKEKPQKPAASTETKPITSRQNQFEFYDKLPNQNVVLPESQIAEEEKAVVLPTHQKPNIPSANVRSKINEKPIQYAYTLQVGSFLNFKDADKHKANLAMLGIGSRIHAIKMSGKTRYRVMLGPYEDIKRVNEINAEMKANNIKTLLLKERLK